MIFFESQFHFRYINKLKPAKSRFGQKAFLFSGCSLLTLLLLSNVQAQNDRHYNSIQYGLRGMIMNGAMVAGVHDNSAIYYNPAALGSSGSEGLDISLFAVSMGFINRKNAYNTGSSQKQTVLDVIPGLITFNARPFKNKGISIAGASFTRSNYRIVGDQITQSETEAGVQVNSFQFEHSGREFWLAGGIGYTFPKNVAIGMSQYFSIRNTKYEHLLSYRLFDPDVPGRLIHEDTEDLVFRFSHTIGLINRLGISWWNDHFKIGATFTTPMYGPVLQSARVFYTRSELEDGETTAMSLDIRKRGTYKSPFSASLGFEFNGKGFLIATSVEYYHGVKDYSMITSSDDDVYPPVPVSQRFSLWDGRQRVFNLNVGWEIRLDKKVDYLGGLRTNMNFNNQPADFSMPRLHYSYFDIYHLTTGLKVRIAHSSFTVGVDYAFSFKGNLTPIADLNNTNIAAQSIPSSSVTYNNLTFLFTYNFILDRFSDIFKNGDN